MNVFLDRKIYITLVAVQFLLNFIKELTSEMAARIWR